MFASLIHFRVPIQHLLMTQQTISQSSDRSEVYFANANNEDGEELSAGDHERIGAVV